MLDIAKAVEQSGPGWCELSNVRSDCGVHDIVHVSNGDTVDILLQ